MFEVGDKVYCLLHGEGKVIEMNTRGDYPVRIQFLDLSESYTFGGQLYKSRNRMVYHGKPEIIIPKSKIKRKLEGWLNMYNDGKMYHQVYKTKEEASGDLVAMGDRVTQVYISGEYEVEE